MLMIMISKIHLIPALSRALLIMVLVVSGCSGGNAQDLFPDGTPIPDWFRDTTKVTPGDLGR